MFSSLNFFLSFYFGEYEPKSMQRKNTYPAYMKGSRKVYYSLGIA